MRNMLVALLVAVVGKLLADEAKEFMAWLPAKLIGWAAKQFPPEIQPRIQEEWTAHCNDLPGNLPKVLHALGCVSTSVRLTRLAAKAVFTAIFVPLMELSIPAGIGVAILLAVLGLEFMQYPYPEEERVRRLRQSAGGLVVLGLGELAPRPGDYEAERHRNKRREKILDAMQSLLGPGAQVLESAADRAVARYEWLLDYFEI
jgi:hypothetical protein